MKHLLLALAIVANGDIVTSSSSGGGAYNSVTILPVANGGTGSATQTFVTAVTGSAPVTVSAGLTPAVSMAAATTSVNGYLTSTDWATFNGKAGTASPTFTGTTAVATLTVSTSEAIGGANSTAVTFHACSAATAFDATATTLGCTASGSITVTGCALGDAVTWGLSTDVSAVNGSYSAVMTGAGTAKARFCTAGTAVDPTTTNITICCTRG